jgi:SAM-dependent methyltransferase
MNRPPSGPYGPPPAISRPAASTLPPIATQAPNPARDSSAPYESDNFFDRHTPAATLELSYRHMMARERSLLTRRLALRGGDVLSVGAGWHPGRHLFPAPAFRLVAVDADPRYAEGLRATERADQVLVGRAGRLGLAPATFDVVLYRLVLHHIADQGPLAPCFAEAASLLRPGGAMIAIEPGLWHPIGAALAQANRTGVATALHGTPDDIPLSPRRLLAEARAVGLDPELHAVTYSWRRLPPRVQRAIQPLDELGSRPRAALFGHTLMLIARACGR